MYWIGGGIAAVGIIAYMVYSSKNTGINSGNDPIVQILSGIIGLFKKKPTQTTTTAPAAYPAV